MSYQDKKPVPPQSQIIKEGHDPKPRFDKAALEQSIKTHEKDTKGSKIVKK